MMLCGKNIYSVTFFFLGAFEAYLKGSQQGKLGEENGQFCEG
jgi:hypothetical protein